MGSLRFRRRIRLVPGLWVNVNKRSVGISAGVPGARASVNTDGRSTRTLSIPGTGLSYRWQNGPRRSEAAAAADPGSDLPSSVYEGIGVFIILVFAALVAALIVVLVVVR